MNKLKGALSLLLCIVLLTAFASACADSGKPVLNVYNWGDYIDPEVVGMFEEEFGIKVNYSLYDTNESMYSKLTNSSSSYDVIFPSDYMIERMSKEGLLAEIDFDNIPNYALIGDSYKGLAYDPDNKYSVPYMWGTLGILYNTTMTGDDEVTFETMFDGKYAGKIFMMDSVRDSIGVTLSLLGYSLNTTDEAQLNEAKEKLIAQKPLVLAYTGDEVKDKMIAGEGAMALIYAGDAYYCIGKNPDLAYALPENSNLFFDGMAIPASSEHKEEAEKFINFMCRTDIALRNTEYIEYATPQVEAYEQLDESVRNSLAYPSAERLASMEVFTSVGDAIKIYDRVWTEVLAS